MGGEATTQDVYFVDTAKAHYLSLEACKSLDDTLLSDSSIEEAFWHTFEFLETCARARVTLKPEKFKFYKRQIEFVGFHLGWT